MNIITEGKRRAGKVKLRKAAHTVSMGRAITDEAVMRVAIMISVCRKQAENKVRN